MAILIFPCFLWFDKLCLLNSELQVLQRIQTAFETPTCACAAKRHYQISFMLRLISNET